MLSFDANILLYGYSKLAPEHERADAFLQLCSQRRDVAVSEFVLTEFYLLLRNPIVSPDALSAAAAVEVIQYYRRHPRWKVVGFPPNTRDLHEALWLGAAAPNFARRRIYDLRTALSLQGFGVTEFATANLKHFKDSGFARVWNPLTP